MNRLFPVNLLLCPIPVAQLVNFVKWILNMERFAASRGIFGRSTLLRASDVGGRGFGGFGGVKMKGVAPALP